jgi:hypothetical protein
MWRKAGPHENGVVAVQSGVQSTERKIAEKDREED